MRVEYSTTVCLLSLLSVIGTCIRSRQAMERSILSPITFPVKVNARLFSVLIFSSQIKRPLLLISYSNQSYFYPDVECSITNQYQQSHWSVVYKKTILNIPCLKLKRWATYEETVRLMLIMLLFIETIEMDEMCECFAYKSCPFRFLNPCTRFVLQEALQHILVSYSWKTPLKRSQPSTL